MNRRRYIYVVGGVTIVSFLTTIRGNKSMYYLRAKSKQITLQISSRRDINSDHSAVAED